MNDIRQRYSSDVRLHLEVAGQSLAVRQIGPGQVLVGQPLDMPPCEADVVMLVDGREHRWRVCLVDGMSADCDRVATRQLAYHPPSLVASADVYSDPGMHKLA